MGKKYLVVSDNHGSMANLEYVIDRFHGQIEGLIHCGDMEIPPEMLEELAGCPVYMAAGNCDYNFSRDKEDIFELGDDTFVGYFSSSPITDIDENYIGQVITASTMASISTQLLSSMGSMMNMFCYFAIIVFVIVLYLLSKLIIERNTLSISMSKILGYTNKEIASLYIISTTIVVIFASLISIPICYKPLLVMFYEMLYTQMSGWIPFIIDKGIGVKMVFMNIVVYMFVSIFEYRRINKA